MKKDTLDIIIVGGGASALAGAISAKRENPKLRIAILEKKKVMASKLKITGNGRCNLSNRKGENSAEVLEFLESCGINVRWEEDRIYPYSEEGKQVAETLISICKRLGVSCITEFDVKKITKSPDGIFTVENQRKESLSGYNLLMATGGKSYGNLGTTGDGYIFARKMGHKVNPLIPALTAIETEENIDSLKGVRSKGIATLYKNGEKISREKGEIQFRKDSLSGICIMNLSLQIRREGSYEVAINFMETNCENIEKLLKKRKKIEKITVLGLLRTLVKESLALEILGRVNLYPDSLAETLSDVEVQKLVKELTDFRLRVKGLKGWNEAQVTLGGVELKEVDKDTMESKLVDNLFFSGEILDYAGPCGGYNLNYAWMTGIKAGKSMGRKDGHRV